VRYLALACDYDGTLATHGEVTESTLAGLQRLRASGRKLVLVTGRELPDLLRVFPRADVFDRVVAENGALLYTPAVQKEVALAPRPPEQFLAALRSKDVEPLRVGRCIVATRQPNEGLVLDTIRELGLELHIAFNKGAVMVLPPSVNKCTGLLAALRELRLSVHNTVGVGDGENDHALLCACEAAVAVANAVPSLKDDADWSTSATGSAGIEELIKRLLLDDLSSLEPRLERHHLLLGARVQDPQHEVRLPPHGTRLLVAGSIKSGKSSLTLGVLERLMAAGYQYCLVDPEGDYEAMDGAVNVGDEHRPPSFDEVLHVLRRPDESVVVCLLALSREERPRYLTGLLPRLEQLHAETARPHWLILDEAHHLAPASVADVNVTAFGGLMLVTVRPGRLARSVLNAVNLVCAVGEAPDRTAGEFAEVVGSSKPASVSVKKLENGEAVLWARDEDRAHHIRVEPSVGDRRRHRRKYALGELPPDRSFYFRGPDLRLRLRAQNLSDFLQLADGVDEATWTHHLRAGDYSRWVRTELKDKKLAKRLAAIEQDTSLSADEARARARAAIEERYAPP
jgi:HAD superfamily hydrolase (TIGR01484 family)